MKFGYRPDIDGLRAIAVMGVLLFHAQLSWVAGGFVGVDIFFVISGYLITSILIRELDETGKVDFLNFWARRTRRLLPSALLVIAVTLIASAFVLPNPELMHAASDAIYASTYLINWTKLISAVQYFDDGAGQGPYLHYWSLAVEEWFYGYITLVFLVAFALRRFVAGERAWPIAKIFILIIVASGVLSFAANLYFVADAQPIAFFGTHSRIWQLALGAGIGLLERGGYRPEPPVRHLVSWIGLAAMLVAIVSYDSKLSYPGVYALLPTIGAGLFILAGINGCGEYLPLPLRLTAASVPIMVGKLSYSLYLWHWPVIVLWKAHQGSSWTSLDAVIALTITFGLSTISHFTVENPLRFSGFLRERPGASLAGAAALSFVVVVSGWLTYRQTGLGGFIVLNNGAIHDPKVLRRELPVTYRNKRSCHAKQKQIEHASCVFGNNNSTVKMVLLGDSHAAQWFPALNKIANKQGIALYPRTKSACPPIDARVWHRKWKREYTECAIWRKGVYEEITRIRPDFIVLAYSSRYKPLDGAGKRLSGKAREEALMAAEQRTIKYLRQQGAKIIFMEETPWHTFDPLTCLAANPRKSEKCRTRQDAALKYRTPMSFTRDGALPDDLAVIDMNDMLCKRGYCYAADDEHVIFRDRHHLTKTYGEFLTDELWRRMSGFIKMPVADRKLRSVSKHVSY